MIKLIAVFAPLFTCVHWGLVLFLAKKPGDKPRVFLGLFMIFASLVFLGQAFFFLKWSRIYTFYDPLFIFSSLMLFPVYYHYIRLLTVDQNWNRNYLYHYLTAIICGILAGSQHLIYHSYSLENSINYFSYITEWHKDEVFPTSFFYLLFRLIFVMQAIFYLYNGNQLINRHQERLANYYSDYGERDVRMVWILHYTFIAVGAAGILFGLTGRSNLTDRPVWLLVFFLVFSVGIFVVGFLGNIQVQLVKLSGAEDSEIKEDGQVPGQMMPRLREKLDSLMDQEKIFLKPNLSIWDVSVALGSNRSYISELINEGYGMNFSQFVNQYRIEEAKKMLRDPATRNLSLETIGEQCGFGSLNNFMRVFRRFENTTPGHYREGFPG